MRRLLRPFPRFQRDETGSASVEFAILVPLFFSLFMIGMDAGLVMVRQVMLDRAVDIVVRELRLGIMAQPNLDDLRTQICNHTAILANCHANMLIELQPVNTATWLLPDTPPACIDRDEEITPVTTITAGGSNQMMIVRACMVVDPLFPTTPWALQLPLDTSGGFQLFATSSFVNEPR